MKKIEYSIVVAAYNVDKHISKCLDSLIKQLRYNCEIIVVDDGSTDNTSSILDNYAKLYDRIRIIHQENQGLFGARRTGIKEASGEYCLMIDADDWIEDDTIERIDNYLKKHGKVDVLKFKFIYEPLGQCGPDYKVVNKILDSEELNELRRVLILEHTYNNLCNQVFKRQLYRKVNDVYGEKMNCGEDIMANLDIIGRAKTVMLVDDALYHYFFTNSDSIIHKTNLNNISRNISNNIMVSKKKIKYLNLYKITDIDSSVIKKNSLIFACKQIKLYILNGNKLRLKDLRNSIDESGINDFIDGIELSDVHGINLILSKCIINRKYSILRLIKIAVVVKNALNKVYNRQ